MPRFADIRGQDRAIESLRRAAAGDRLPHALLFHGTRGVGKTATALALLQFLNCEAPAGGDACGRCRTCHLMARLQHPDLHWYFPMAGTEGGVRLKADKRADHIARTTEERAEPGIFRLRYGTSATIAIGRDSDTYPGSMTALRHEAGIKPVEARVKGFVVTEADRMSTDAANSILKTLEEPLPGNLIVLCTAHPGDLLPTIVSRCRQVAFRDLGEEEIAALVGPGVTAENERREAHNRRVRKEENRQPPIDPRGVALAAALAQGSVTGALDLLDAGVTDVRDEAIAFFRLAPGSPRAAEVIDALTPSTWEGTAKKLEKEIYLRRMLQVATVWLGDLVRAAVGSDLPPANRDRAKEIAREAATLGVGEIRRRLRAVETAQRALAGNVMPLLVLNELLGAWAGERVRA